VIELKAVLFDRVATLIHPLLSRDESTAFTFLIDGASAAAAVEDPMPHSEVDVEYL